MVIIDVCCLQSIQHYSVLDVGLFYLLLWQHLNQLKTVVGPSLIDVSAETFALYQHLFNVGLEALLSFTLIVPEYCDR